jgi:hypothetical protein
MNPETQKSLQTHNDEALAMIGDVNESTIPAAPSAEIIPFPIDRVQPAPSEPVESNPFPSDVAAAREVRQDAEVEPKKSRLGIMVGVGTAALLALGFAPRSHDAPAPTPTPDTFVDQAQQSAQTPYDPAKDELLIGNIRVKPGNSNLNSASEAVLGNPDVKAFEAANPDETTSLEASAMVLPTNASGEYAVVARDVDNDGDSDAIAVPSNK